MQQVLSAFSVWIEHTPLSEAIKNQSEWLIPLVQSVHILGIAAVMATIVFFDLRMLGLTAQSQTLHGMVKRLMPAMWGALGVLLFTGAVMIIGEPVRSLDNPVFQIKMVLLACAVLLTIRLTKPVRSNPQYWDEAPSRQRGGRLMAGISIGIWILIIFAGRLIAYYDPSIFVPA